MSKRPLGSFESRVAGLPLKDAIRLALRTVFSVAFEARKQVIAEAKVYVPIIKKDGNPGLKYNVFYRCAKCQGLFKEGEWEVDHIEEVGTYFRWPPIDREELTNWLERLLCDKSNLQLLCKPDHRAKSGKDTRKRAKVRRSQRTKAHPK